VKSLDIIKSEEDKLKAQNFVRTIGQKKTIGIVDKRCGEFSGFCEKEKLDVGIQQS